MTQMLDKVSEDTFSIKNSSKLEIV